MAKSGPPASANAEVDILGAGVDDVALPNLGDGSAAGTTGTYAMGGLMALAALLLGSSLGVRTAAARRRNQ